MTVQLIGGSLQQWIELRGGWIMDPRGAHPGRLAIESHNLGDALRLTLRLDLAGGRGEPWLDRLITQTELAELYEREHHHLHGSDPRGLDPRDGPTRLTPGARLDLDTPGSAYQAAMRAMTGR